MHSGTRLSAGPIALTIVVVATFAGLATTAGTERRREAATTQAPAPRPMTPTAAPRACATPWGLCPVPPVRVGEPCACPHPLHGAVRGRVLSLVESVAPVIRPRLGGEDDPPRRLGPRRDD